MVNGRAKLAVKDFFGNLRIARETTKTLILALIPFLAMLLTMILSSVYSEYLEIVDKEFAADVIITDPITGSRSYGKETDTQYFFSNPGVTLFIIFQAIAVVIAFIVIGCGKIFKVSNIYRSPSIYLHILIPVLAYVIVYNILNLVLKRIYSRPRPYQTKEYGIRTGDDLCYYPYLRIYDIKNRSIIKKLNCFSASATSSFPSGHVGSISQALLATVIVLHYLFNFLNEQVNYVVDMKKKTKMAYKVLYIIIVPIFWAIYIVFAAIMCSARITAGKHFFSDVINGFILGSGTVFSMIVFNPSEKYVLERINSNYVLSSPGLFADDSSADKVQKNNVEENTA